MNKEEQIRDYADKMFQKLEETGVYLSDEEKEELISPFLSQEGPVDEITEKLLQATLAFKEKHDRTLASISSPIGGIEFYQIPNMHHGITLNEQDIDLLNIVGARTPEELQQVARTLLNIPTNLTDVTYENLEEQKRALFKRYTDVLIPKKDFFIDNNVHVKAMLQYLFNIGFLTEEEKAIIGKIISEEHDRYLILGRLKEALPPSRVTEILRILRDLAPIEKSGIKSSTYEAYVNLYNQLPKFNSVTIDDQFKYGSIVLGDGTMVFKHFEKCLRFAEQHNLQVRGNSLISYMGCPDDLYNKEPSEQTHDEAYKALDNYIKGMFSLLSRPEYKDRVRSIDIFNELLTRKGPDYVFRGDAPQDVAPSKLDDVKSGWFKHLSLEDIFKLIADNKHLLDGKVDFMYNEVFLEDPKKMEEFHKIMESIQKFEQTNHVQIIDTLGIQMHIDSKITPQQLATMFRSMAKYGYPIEITEFDMTMNPEDIRGLNEQQILRVRQMILNSIFKTINGLREECNIKGFTIWSLTDKHNFEVSLENEQRIAEGKEPIETLHGGYFTEEMTPKGEQVELGYQQEQVQQEGLEQDKPKSLTYKPPKPKVEDEDNQGFANILVIAIVVGGFLGILLAFAMLNIR